MHPCHTREVPAQLRHGEQVTRVDAAAEEPRLSRLLRRLDALLARRSRR